MFHTIGRITGWTKEYNKRLYLGYICSFLSSWCTAAPIMLAAWLLEKMIEDSKGEAILGRAYVGYSIAGMVLAIFLRFLFTYWKNKLQESIGYEVAAKQRIQIGDTLKRVSLGYFSEKKTGDILAAVTTELSTLELQGMKMIDAVVNGYLQVAAIICFVAFVSFPAAAVCMAGVILSAFALHGIGKQSAETAPVIHKANEDLSGASIEYIRGLAVVKSFGQEGASINYFKKAAKDSKNICIKNEYGFVPWNCLHLFSLKSASVALVTIAAWEALQGIMGGPMFLMICFFSFTIFGGAESINDAAHILSVIDEVLDKLEDMEKAPFLDKDGKEINLNSYDIVFDKVSFGYGDREILHDITFRIPEKTTTAVIGPSGSGKSTICSLVARFYDVDAGAVKVGGHDVREFTCDSLLQNISMVFQNVYLFRDTITNNIRFGKEDASMEEIVEAAKKARCHDFILALPDGYDTVIGEGGASLSGGEKQRVSIARAILKDAPVIILDEATASIDPENEAQIQTAIGELTRNKTIIIIAHRLATIEEADQILVLEEGRITQQGRHEELVGSEGLYRKFISIREKAEGWRIV
ncbi:ABC transporter ATP-binding protein [Anaerocolumna xylanovorans]|uniref:ATP-binding cassette, subfamily B n=1 Tax=Anaerocolumna xylanovorans DSM 12503 TaxID=1121345 RepID=A0A1M7YM20_9FIRM|nr:ABC transporter ATP-binding protein [Anaerocolumna xylanovorans]SHO53647.1 ATP-binding cassette, subfamily B [Anaerocolumna xylanovorans DSM 12503]